MMPVAAVARTIAKGFPIHSRAAGSRCSGLSSLRPLQSAGLRAFGTNEQRLTYSHPPNQYNRVERIILVRHGESEGNVDESSYVTTADWRIPLTDRGRQQARDAGAIIKSHVGDGRLFFYFSPYRRTRQTLHGILECLSRDQVAGLREEPRISEQQFGNFQDVAEVRMAKEERHLFGRFYFRFPQGESGLDVYQRVSSFIGTVLRDLHQLRAEGQDLGNGFNLCIVTHGLTLRLFLMRWFQYTVEEFEDSHNPENGAVIILERHTNTETGLQWYEVAQESLTHLNLPRYADQQRFKIADNLEILEHAPKE